MSLQIIFVQESKFKIGPNLMYLKLLVLKQKFRKKKVSHASDANLLTYDPSSAFKGSFVQGHRSTTKHLRYRKLFFI